jgi:biotin synthase
MSAHQFTAPLIQAKSRPPVVGATWTLEAVTALYNLPFNEIMFRAQETHRQVFPEGDVELATLLSIKTGGCPEDCSYCPQAARYHTDVKASKLLDLEEVLEAFAWGPHGANPKTVM